MAVCAFDIICNMPYILINTFLVSYYITCIYVNMQCTVSEKVLMIASHLWNKQSIIFRIPSIHFSNVSTANLNIGSLACQKYIQILAHVCAWRQPFSIASMYLLFQKILYRKNELSIHGMCFEPIRISPIMPSNRKTITSRSCCYIMATDIHLCEECIIAHTKTLPMCIAPHISAYSMGKCYYPATLQYSFVLLACSARNSSQDIGHCQ